MSMTYDPFSRGGGYPGAFGGPGGSGGFPMRPPQMGIGSFMRSDPTIGMAGGPMGPPQAPGIIPGATAGPYPQPGAAKPQGIGGHIKGALDWLTDEEQGGNRTNLLLGTAGIGMQAYGAHQDRKRYEAELARERELEDEQRQRMATASPYLAQMFAQMRGSQGGG